MSGPMTARHVRTFHGRHGRVTERMRAVLGALGPARALTTRPAWSGRPLVLEVGAGHGEAAMAFAAGHPGTDVVAADVHTPGIVHLLEAVEDEGLDNVFVERADALDLLDDVIAPATLDALHLFFPDPWPKNRHHKRRFIRPDVLDLAADRLVPGGVLLVATDVEEYARWALDRLDRHPRFVGGESSRPAWRPVTRYEAQAISAGRRIIELEHRRR